MRKSKVNPGWLEAQLAPLLHRSLSPDEQRVLQAEFSRQRRDLWEDLGQLLFVEILSHPAEADDIRRAVWRVSKRLARESLKTHSLSPAVEVSQSERATDIEELRQEIQEFLTHLSDYERSLILTLLDDTPMGVSDSPEQKRRLRSSIRKIRETYRKYC